jgi:probable rRNA maturation factor
MKLTLQLIIPQRTGIPSKARMQKILTTAASLLKHPRLNKNTEVLIRIVKSDEIQKLNATYRHKDYPTNVLAFPFEAPPGLASTNLGDIIIGHEVLQKEAKAQHKTLTDHYAHMLVHGFLHLLGYDHIKDVDAKKMEQLELRILQKLNIANPYEEPHE